MELMIANYSRELADYIIYVIDVSGGDKIPRKGGPGISQSDLLIVNKVCLTLPLSPLPRSVSDQWFPLTSRVSSPRSIAH